LKTALFVDFDNVYLGLKRTDPRAAEVFAAQPARWLSWLESNPHGRSESGSTPRTAKGRRDTLVRRCYLNPRSFSGYRHHFVCSAFEVIDCPPMTSHAKNGSDIRMVMDILDTLQHPTRFDEFMILSGDADFTPVLLRLRAYDRRTAVLAVSNAAEAYRAACHWPIAESLFIRDALGIGPLTLPPLASVLPQAAPQAAPPAPAPVPEPLPSDTAAPPSPPPASPPPASPVQLDDLKRAILACVQKLVADSPEPVELAVAAQAVMSELGPSVLETRWAGAGRFKSLLRELNLAGLQILTNADPGFILDPKRHTLAPKPLEPPRLEEVPKTFEQRVHNATQTPLLTPQQYAVLFKTAAEVMSAAPYNLTTTSKELRDRLVASNEKISRQSVSFVLKGALQSPAVDPAEPKDTSALGLARAFTRNVIYLCRQAELELAPEDLTRIEHWIAGGFERPDGH
jgi:hypothetical protein